MSFSFKYDDQMLKQITEEAGYIYSCFERRKKSMLYVGFICPKHEAKGVQFVLLERLKHKKVCCGACNGKNRTTEEFADMVHEKHPYIDVIGHYLGAHNKIEVKCAKHEYSWSPYAYNLLEGYGCPICGREQTAMSRRIPSSDKIKKLIILHPDIEFLSVPILTTDKVLCKCKICGRKWNTAYSNLSKQNHTSCPSCSSSKGELIIKSLLEKWDIPFIPQYKFEDLIDTFQLPFDFYLPSNNVLIEFDGELHYRPRRVIEEKKKDAYDDYQKIKKHDQMKTQYCKDNNIQLIRIPYWYRDDLEYILFDELVKCNVLEEIKEIE